jgi:hypothetical protein
MQFLMGVNTHLFFFLTKKERIPLFNRVANLMLGHRMACQRINLKINKWKPIFIPLRPCVGGILIYINRHSVFTVL